MTHLEKKAVRLHQVLYKRKATRHPDLLSQNEQAASLLSRIHRYLFVQKKLKDTALERQLPPELYTALYGLKALAKEHGLAKAQLILENSKQRFAAFLDEELKG